MADKKSPKPKTMLAFGDVHIPHQNLRAVEVFCRAAERIRPDLIVCLGDLLDCGQFSSHPPTHGVVETEYQEDLAAANALLDRLQACCQKLVMVEGNHEYRLDRWAAQTSEGRGAYSMLAPRLQLSKGRTGGSKFSYVPYGSATARYPHYAINSRIIPVHGWSYAQHATKNHLQISQGKSVIHGHTHRADSSIIQNIWSPGQVVQARSGGFPCEITDDPVLDLLLADEGSFPNAEERRLFYVALTRARHRVYLLADAGNSSSFISELCEPAYQPMVEVRAGKFENAICRVCHDRLVPRMGKYGRFWSCVNYPYCRHTHRQGVAILQPRRGPLLRLVLPGHLPADAVPALHVLGRTGGCLRMDVPVDRPVDHLDVL